MKKLINKRFDSIVDIENHLRSLGYKEVNVFESESEILEDLDFQLDGCVDGKDFTLFYIRDRGNRYYITEFCFWN